MKYRMRVEKSVVIIQSYYRGWRVRRYFQWEEAAIIIQSYFRGWRVRKETRILFKQVAGPKIANFMWRALVSIKLSSN